MPRAHGDDAMRRTPTRLARIAAAALAGGGAAAAAAASEGAAPSAVARVDAPARVAVSPGERAALAPERGAVLIVTVASYTPAREGSVSAEVDAHGPSGESVPVGGFGVFPNVAFSESDPASGMSFALPLAPERLRRLGGAPTEIVVRLEPFGAAASGAQMTIGGVELRPR
jgi:hypothetical protein